MLSITELKRMYYNINTLLFVQITNIFYSNIHLESNQVIPQNRNIVKKRLNMIMISLPSILQTKHNYTAKHEILRHVK